MYAWEEIGKGGRENILLAYFYVGRFGGYPAVVGGYPEGAGIGVRPVGVVVPVVFETCHCWLIDLLIWLISWVSECVFLDVEIGLYDKIVALLKLLCCS